MSSFLVNNVSTQLNQPTSLEKHVNPGKDGMSRCVVWQRQNSRLSLSDTILSVAIDTIREDQETFLAVSSADLNSK